MEFNFFLCNLPKDPWVIANGVDKAKVIKKKDTVIFFFSRQIWNQTNSKDQSPNKTQNWSVKKIKNWVWKQKMGLLSSFSYSKLATKALCVCFFVLLGIPVISIVYSVQDVYQNWVKSLNLSF